MPQFGFFVYFNQFYAYRFYTKGGFVNFSINTSFNTLAATNAFNATLNRISETLQQLSTGVAVTPKSDPAAFIAGTLMESDIIAANQAAKNSQINSAVLNIAESGASQITSLLQEANALSVAAANEAANTPEMQAAYQQQMDAIVGSINRISSSTSYLGMPLLDGTYTQKTAQLGTDVTSAQQTAMSVRGMNATSLGQTTQADGSTLSLASLASANGGLLTSDPGAAQSIIKQALSEVTTARADIGTFQKYTLEVAEEQMNNLALNLTGAKSTIMDTDFAVATSNLIRDTILAQTTLQAIGLSTLSSTYAASLL